MKVRVRYAPSPTGFQHIGGLRTALFNYYFARSMGGVFILRIEDTDRERFHPEGLRDIFENFDWLGIDYDEGPSRGGPFGPYVQSEGQALYRKHAHELVASGHAYPCFCSSERLDAMREAQKREKSSALGYDRQCRSLDPAEAARRMETGEKFVIRLKIPLEGSTSFDDLLMGTIARENKDISPDPVLLKSDGFPTYHLANVVDDHRMEITHILRAQEWIPTCPVHVNLYAAFGWTPPIYCHLPMVLGQDGQKLSKRHGSTSVRDFREQGYLPDALLNYISLLGWAFDDTREFFTREELCRVFSLERLNKAPGVFDYKKLEWFNGQYIRQKSDAELALLVEPYFVKAGLIAEVPTAEEKARILAAMPLVKERLKFLREAPEMLAFIFRRGTLKKEDLIPKKCDAAEAVRLLGIDREILSATAGSSLEAVEEAFRARAEKEGVKLGTLMSPLRAATTYSAVSPPLVPSMHQLGTEETLRRIEEAIKILEKKD